MSKKTIIIFIPMNKMISTNRTSIVPAIFKGLAGAIFIFAVLTAISYQNDLPVDGKLVIGFPWEFYSEGTGYNLERDEYASFQHFKLFALICNIVFSAFVSALLFLLYRVIPFRKRK